MLEEEKERVTKKINRLSKQGYFAAKQVYLFGASDHTRQIITILRVNGIEPVGVIDNDVSKQKSLCARKQVISITEVGDVQSKEKVFLIFSASWREMVFQLKRSGADSSQIVFLGPVKKSLVKHICEAKKGKNEYKKIIKRYSTNNVFLCPYTGTGDVYLIGTFWNEYCEMNKIENYVFAVMSSACKKVAQLCGIKNIELLENQKISSCIISAHMLWPNEVKLKLLNDCWFDIHTNQIEWFRGYKGLEFTPMFKKYVFSLPDSSKPIHPAVKSKKEEVLEIMRSKNLSVGKTVVLSPYSNTLSEISDVFWEKVTDELLEKGYSVCTNSSGNTEPAVKGSVSVFFPLSIAPEFVETAGTFIGIRSGFCDVISGAKAKKIVLYDRNNRFYMGSAFEYFNLKDMELCDDAWEIEFDNNQIDNCLEKVMEIIGEYVDVD